MQIIIVTGLSGSGKSVAMRTLEDMGYYSMDNVMPQLLPQLLPTIITELDQTHTRHIALGIDIRSHQALNNLAPFTLQLEKAGHDVRIVFLTASSQTLITRFSETRRKHPLNHIHHHKTLCECIDHEREILVSLEGLGQVIDTSFLKPAQLGERLRDLLNAENTHLTLVLESFAFKRGVPLDADLVFDARCLPNPYYQPELRPLTGRDQTVANYLLAQTNTQEWLNDIETFLRRWLPRYTHDNRSYLTVAIGCTGGQHRSVFCVEHLAKQFNEVHALIVRHREYPTHL